MTEYDDLERAEFYLTEGLLNVWWNLRLVDEEHRFVDPPVLNRAHAAWVAGHPGVTVLLAGMGPPTWTFPSAELREEFKSLFIASPEEISAAQDDEEALERGRRRRQHDQLKFKASPLADRLDVMAQVVYFETFVDWQGYPNGAPYWHQLVELDRDNPGLSRSNFRNAAWRVLELAGHTEEELRDDEHWDWRSGLELPSTPTGYGELVADGWQLVGHGARRRKADQA